MDELQPDHGETDKAPPLLIKKEKEVSENEDEFDVIKLRLNSMDMQ